MTKKPKLGRAPIYPWDEWFKKSRQRTVLAQGEDFNCTPYSMATYIRLQARLRGIRVGVSITGCGLAQVAIIITRKDS